MFGADDDTAHANWRKAKRSKIYGDCVEVSGGSGIIATRDSKDRLGPVIRYPAASWQAFLVGTKSGEGRYSVASDPPRYPLDLGSKPVRWTPLATHDLDAG